jgi:hypothetical protein
MLLDQRILIFNMRIGAGFCRESVLWPVPLPGFDGWPKRTLNKLAFSHVNWLGIASKVVPAFDTNFPNFGELYEFKNQYLET